MKKIISLLSVLFFLTGCSAVHSKVKPVTSGISFSCEAVFYNEVFLIDGTVEKNGDTFIKFNSPAQIEGLKYTYTANGVSVNFNEVEYIADKKIFESSLSNFIYEVLKNKDTQVLIKDDVFFIKGKADNFEYKLELGATGLPIKLTTVSDAVVINFKNVRIK